MSRMVFRRNANYLRNGCIGSVTHVALMMKLVPEFVPNGLVAIALSKGQQRRSWIITDPVPTDQFRPPLVVKIHGNHRTKTWPIQNMTVLCLIVATNHVGSYPGNKKPAETAGFSSMEEASAYMPRPS